MQFFQDIIQLGKHDRGAYEITELINSVIKGSGIHTGLCHIFIHSSTASLILSDIADENTKSATAEFMAELMPSGNDADTRLTNGMNAIPEEIRPALSMGSLTIPVTNARSGIGIWQGIFLWEQKSTPIERKLTVTISGEPLHKSFRLTRNKS